MTFTFDSSVFHDTPFRRTELLEIEAECEAERLRAIRLARGINAYAAAIEAFADAHTSLADACTAYCAEQETAFGSAAAARLPGHGSAQALVAKLLARAEAERVAKVRVELVAAQKLSPVAEGSLLRDYHAAQSAAAVSASAYELTRRADSGERRRAARLVLEEARFPMLSAALAADRLCRTVGLDAMTDLLELDCAPEDDAAAQLAAAKEELRRESKRLAAEQGELSAVFVNYCTFLSGTGPEVNSAATGPDSSSRVYKQIASAMLLTAEPGCPPVPVKQGLLLKRYRGVTMDAWKRRYFVADSHGHFYYISNSDRPLPRPAAAPPVLRQISCGSHGGSSPAPGAAAGRQEPAAAPELPVGGKGKINLLLATVRAERSELPSQRFMFTVQSRDDKLELQCESEAERDEWITALQVVTSELINRQSPGADRADLARSYARSSSQDASEASAGERAPSMTSAEMMALLRRVPGNDTCAECGADAPDWASLNLGVLVCLQCSGVHRRVGAHISKVRSCVLDVSAWTPAAIELFKVVGNALSALVWEERLAQSGVARPRPDDGLDAKAAFIISKYVERRFLRVATAEPHVLLDAVRRSDVVTVLGMLICSAGDDAEWVAAAGAALAAAAAAVPMQLGLLELLLHHAPRAALHERDAAGRTPLHVVARAGCAEAASALLARGADPSVRDAEGRLPSDLVPSTGNNAALTLLLASDSSADRDDVSIGTPSTPAPARVVDSDTMNAGGYYPSL